MYVTEDTTRARPETLSRLYSEAVRAGASRVCVADTTGHATPEGARRVVAEPGIVAQTLDYALGGGEIARRQQHEHALPRLHKGVHLGIGADIVDAGIGQRVGGEKACRRMR
jgi:2-isopropylmalate synthase